MGPGTNIGSSLCVASRGFLLLAAFIVLAMPALAAAQVTSEGKGTMTIEVGKGWGPFGGIAAQTADPSQPTDAASEHRTAFRLLAGYQFAEHVSVDLGLTDLGTYKSSVPYAGTDSLQASSTLIAVETELTLRYPVASNLRLDLAGGAAVTGFNTTITTANGASIPANAAGTLNVRRFGPTAGLDFEWRLSDVTSFIIGYHAYTHVGSTVLRESAGGTASAIFGGLHFEF